MHHPTFNRTLPFDPPPPPSSFHHFSFVFAFTFVCARDPFSATPRLITVDNPDDTPRLPPPGKVFAAFVLPFFFALVDTARETTLSSLSSLEASSSTPSVGDVERGRFEGFAEGAGLEVLGAGDFDRVAAIGRTFVSQVLRCNLNRAIVARASVTWQSLA